MSKTVGIDLGTTNSVVAIVEGGEPIVITTAERDRLTPSMVAFKENGECLVGQMAKRQATLNPENTVSSIKRLMGRRFDDPETAVERTRLPYEIVPGPQGNVCAKVLQTGQTHAPQEISAMILDKLKKDAESYLGAPVTKAVITVPAYFNDSQRQATKEAGQIAGLDVLRIVNEPTAAALAYGLDKKEEETILVFDLGGGTFDVSILEVSNGLIQVIATQGDTHLGGDDWDMALVEWITSEFLRKQGINLKQDRHALQRVREAAEKAKIELSTVIETQINLPFITTGSKGSKHLQMNLTRSTLEELTQHLVQRLSEPVYRAMQDAQVGAGDLDAVVLVGGCTRMPMVQELVQGLTGQEPRHSVHAEEAVARGAALQAAILAGDKDDMVLLDVIPLSLGLETLGGMMTPLIPRNTTIPTRKSQVFSTAEDEQTTVEIRVLQGERPMSGDNTTLGVFRLEGIPPAPRGIPQIEVMFDIDANGILNVTARDKSTGHSQAITIATCTDLNEAEVEQQIQEAAQHAPEDRQRRELTEARNAARQLIHQVQRSLSTLEEQVGDQTRQQLERRIAKLKGAITGTDTNRIQRLTATLQKTAPELSQAVYTRRSSDYTGGIQNGKANDGNEAKIVIEGEFDTA